MKKAAAPLVILTLVALLLVFPATRVQAGEAKKALESALVGKWAVPENKYKEKISFDFTKDRTFECVHEVPKKEAVTWSGNWKVRTASNGAVKAYLKARNQANPEQYMKAIIICDKTLENFAIDIVFNFKSPDKSNWSSKLERSSGDNGGESLDKEESGGDEDLDEDEDLGGDEELQNDENSAGDEESGGDEDFGEDE